MSSQARRPSDDPKPVAHVRLGDLSTEEVSRFLQHQGSGGQHEWMSTRAEARRNVRQRRGEESFGERGRRASPANVPALAPEHSRRRKPDDDSQVQSNVSADSVTEAGSSAGERHDVDEAKAARLDPTVDLTTHMDSLRAATRRRFDPQHRGAGLTAAPGDAGVPAGGSHWSEQEWDQRRSQFLKYYVDDKKRLEHVAELMSKSHAFDATLEQWRHHLQRWHEAGLAPTGIVRSPSRASATISGLDDAISSCHTTRVPLTGLDLEEMRPSPTDGDEERPEAQASHNNSDSNGISSGGSAAGRHPEQEASRSISESYDIESGLDSRPGSGRWTSVAENTVREVKKRPFTAVVGTCTLLVSGMQLAQRK